MPNPHDPYPLRRQDRHAPRPMVAAAVDQQHEPEAPDSNVCRHCRSPIASGRWVLRCYHRRNRVK